MNLPDLSTLGTLGVGAALAAVVAGWQQVRGFLVRLSGILVTTTEFRYMGSYAALVYCKLHLRTMPSPFRTYDGTTNFIRPRGQYGVVFREVLGSRGRLYWRGMVPVWVSQSGGADPSVSIRFIRWTVDPDRLAMDISEAYELRKTDGANRFWIQRLSGRSGKSLFAERVQSKGSSPTQEPTSAGGSAFGFSGPDAGRLVGWGVNEIGERVPLTAPLGRLALTEDVQDAVSAIERWFKSKDWYAERQIPWRFGLGLHGVPGTGKSSLVKALAQHLRIPIYLLDISTMDNEEFHNAYQTALANTPAVVLIEDIDAVFKGRENIAAEKGKGLTFDCLLNVISGVESSDGLLLVITTNHIEDVDDALGVPKGDSLSSRPGRIDRMVEMPLLDLDGRRRLATRILAGCHPSWVDYMVSDGGFETGAQFEDRCATLALNLFWSKDPQRPAPEVDEERSVA